MPFTSIDPSFANHITEEPGTPLTAATQTEAPPRETVFGLQITLTDEEGGITGIGPPDTSIGTEPQTPVYPGSFEQAITISVPALPGAV